MSSLYPYLVGEGADFLFSLNNSTVISTVYLAFQLLQLCARLAHFENISANRSDRLGKITKTFLAGGGNTRNREADTGAFAINCMSCDDPGK